MLDRAPESRKSRDKGVPPLSSVPEKVYPNSQVRHAKFPFRKISSCIGSETRMQRLREAHTGAGFVTDAMVQHSMLPECDAYAPPPSFKRRLPKGKTATRRKDIVDGVFASHREQLPTQFYSRLHIPYPSIDTIVPGVKHMCKS